MADPQSKAESYTPFFISGVLRLDVSGDNDAMAPPALTDNTYSLQPSVLKRRSEQRCSFGSYMLVESRSSSFFMCYPLPSRQKSNPTETTCSRQHTAHKFPVTLTNAVQLCILYEL
uniref:Uncharacterized protein n=1 Tax=Bionectria ochroleuca TaxID=29856 RepID=A0A8H7N7L2_BIOOC